MDDTQRQDILKIANFIATGKSFTEWGVPYRQLKERYDPISLAEMVDRARTIYNASGNITGLQPNQPLRDIWPEAYKGIAGGTGGPLETDRASVFARVEIVNASGARQWRSFRNSYLWDMTVDDLAMELADEAAVIAGQYGFEEGEVPLNEVRIR